MINYKFQEDKILKEVESYIDQTYSQHYANGKYQATDMIIDSGHGEGFSVGQTGGNKTFAIDAVTGNITSSGIISASGNVIAADVTIGALSIGKAAKGSIGNYGSTLDVGSGRAFTFQINSIPDIDGKLQSAKVPAKTIPTFIKNTSATADDIVVINCTTENLSATVFGQDTATAKSTPVFFVSLGNESDMAFNVGSASFTGIIL